MKSLLVLLTLHELRRYVKSGRYALVCGICGIAIPMTLALRGLQYGEDTSSTEALPVDQSDDDLTESVRVKRTADFSGILVQGFRKSLVETFEISPAGGVEIVGSLDERIFSPPFETLDFPFLVGVVLSLLTITLVYDTVAGERESGTLLLLSSYAVPRDLLIFAKALGCLVAVMIPYLAGALGGLLACLHLGGASLGTAEMLEFVAIVGLGGVHIASVISVGLFLSILFESSAAALGASLMCWLVAAVLIPSASPYMAEAIIGERRTDVDEAVERLRRASDEELDGLVDEWARERGVDRRSWKESDELWGLAGAYESKVDAEVGRLRESHRNHLFRLLRVTMWLTEISPSGLYRSTSMDLAGTGEDTESRFLRAILRYRADWSDYAQRRDAPILEAIEEMIRTGRGFTSGAEETVPLDPPAFTFDRQPVVERLGGAIYKIGVMFLETVGLFFLGWFWFRRKALV